MPTLIEKLKYLYSLERNLPKLVEGSSILTQDIESSYVKPNLLLLKKNSGEKTPIDLNDLFSQTSKSKFLIKGDIGTGKSTLLHGASFQWSRDNIYHDKFDYVFKIKLKLLRNKWKEDYSRDELRENFLSCFIHYSLSNHANKLSSNPEYKISLKEVSAALATDQNKILLLIDSGSEVNLAKKDEDIQNILSQMLAFKNIIMTSRTNSLTDLIENHFECKIENAGFTQDIAREFVDKYFSNQKRTISAGIESFFAIENPETDLIQYFLSSADPLNYEIGLQLKKINKTNPLVATREEVLRTIDAYYQGALESLNILIYKPEMKELISNPMTISMLCLLFFDPLIRQELDNNFSTGRIYKEFIIWLGKRYLNKPDQEELSASDILLSKEMQILEAIAFEAIQHHNLINGEKVEKISKEHGLSISEVYALGLLKVSIYDNDFANQDLIKHQHAFVRLSIQDYLTALSLYNKLIDEDETKFRKAAEFIADNRHDPRYLIIIKFIGEMISKHNQEKESSLRFWEAVTCNIDGVLELGLDRKVILLMHLLEVTKTDAQTAHRTKIIEFIDNIVTSNLLEWQEELRISGYMSDRIELAISAAEEAEFGTVIDDLYYESDQEEEYIKLADNVFETLHWEEKIEHLLTILSKNNLDLSLEEKQELHNISRKALLNLIKDIKDENSIWIINNIERLRAISETETKQMIKLMYHHALSDYIITKTESLFIIKCIEVFGFTNIIKRSEQEFLISFDGINYPIKGEKNSEYLYDIATASLIRSDNILARQLKEHKPLFKNSGSAIAIAASDLNCMSIVDKAPLSETDWHASFLYLSDHKKSAPQKAFLLMEKRIFGRYMAYKIHIKNGIVLINQFFKHPDHVNQLQKTILGKMEYIDSKPIYYGKIYNLLPDLGNELINKIKTIIQEGKSTTEEIELPKSTIFSFASFLASSSSDKTEFPSPARKKGSESKLEYQLLIDLLNEAIGENPTEPELFSGNWIDDTETARIFTKQDLLPLEYKRKDSVEIEYHDKVNYFESMFKGFDPKLLESVMTNEKLRKTAKAEVTQIEGDTYKYAFYQALIWQLNSVYVASQSIASGLTKSNTITTAGKIGNILETISAHTPLVGIGVSLIGQVFDGYGKFQQNLKIENYANIVTNIPDMSILSEKIARRLALSELNIINKKAAADIIEQAADTAQELIQTSVSSIVANVCRNFHDRIESIKADEDIEEHKEGKEPSNVINYAKEFIQGPKSNQNDPKTKGETDANIIAKLIIENIFAGKYKTKIPHSIDNKANSIVTDATEEFEGIAYKRKSILPFQLRSSPEKHQHKSSQEDSSYMSATSDPASQISSSDSLDAQASPRSSNDSIDTVVSSSVVHAENVGAEQQSAPSNINKHCCTIMAVPEITHDNQVYSQNRLEGLLAVASNEESYKQFLSDVETQGLEKTIDSLLFNQFLQKAQQQLTEEELAKLIELGKDPDIAEQILLNEKTILDIIFNKQPIDPLLDSINKIENFLGEAEAGLSNNIFNALSNNYLTNSAQALIKAIGSHISSIQTLINQNINPDMMMAIFAQLDGLLEYGASGRAPLPFYRPPSGDPDWGGMPGGGSSWEEKSPTNHSESTPMFIGLNLTDIEWIAK